MVKPKNVQRQKLLLEAIRVVLHSKFTKAHDRGPALGFNGETSPRRALRLATEHLASEGLQEADVVWNGYLLASLLLNGVNAVDVIIVYQTQEAKAKAYIKHHGKPTEKVPSPDIRIVVRPNYCTPGDIIDGRVQVPFNCDSAY